MKITTIERHTIRIRTCNYMESQGLEGVDKSHILSIEEYCIQIKTVQINPSKKGDL